MEDLEDLDLNRSPALPLMRRAFELRANVTAYVALAERLHCPLVADGRLVHPSGSARPESSPE